MVNTTVTMYAMVIIAALLIGSLLFYLVFIEIGSQFGPADIKHPTELTYNIEFVKAAMQPYIYLFIVSYINDGDALEQGIMSMYSETPTYLNPEPIWNVISKSIIDPAYFALEIRDIKDPLKQTELFKLSSKRCGRLGHGICEKTCSLGRKEESKSNSYCRNEVCCIDDPDASVERCGPASNPKIGVCEKKETYDVC